MSTISQYNQKKQLMAQLAEELKQLESSEELKKEMQFQADIEALLGKYGKSAAEAVSALVSIDPSVSVAGNKKASAKATAGRSRATMVYTNPHTKETVKTKGGNNKTLKEWREKWGADAVDSWKSKE